jgi:hypothetical protein
MKADLITYGGVIGFQTPWLIAQGYAGRNILKLLVDESIKKDIDVVPVMSMHDIKKIPRGSIHDRYGLLLESSQNLPANYFTKKIGENAFTITKGEKTIYILNGQGVITQDKKGKTGDFWVIGTNQIQNRLSLEESLSYGKDLIKIAPSGIKPWTIKEPRNVSKFFDAICYDDMADKFAQIPLINTSRAHTIKEIGTRYIEFKNNFQINKEEDILQGLKDVLKKGNYLNGGNGANIFTQLRWKIPFATYLVGMKVLGKLRE